MRAFRLAYDGRPFAGFQRQPDVPTVENALLDALDRLDALDVPLGETDTPRGYAAAGRTDAGVSALAQTVAFACPDWLTPRALNAELPSSVRAWASADVPADFHATHDAVERIYTYHLYAPDADDGRARSTLAALSGTHDFHNLTPDDAGTERELRGDLSRDGDYLVLSFRAPGFARQLVRRLVSLVRAVASGAADPSKVDRVLAPAPLDGPAGVAPAPPEPLVLLDVSYPGVAFERDPDAAADARTRFDDLRVAATTTSRVTATIRDGIDGSVDT